MLLIFTANFHLHFYPSYSFKNIGLIFISTLLCFGCYIEHLSCPVFSCKCEGKKFLIVIPSPDETLSQVSTTSTGTTAGVYEIPARLRTLHNLVIQYASQVCVSQPFDS